eukprot:s1235_g12.t1
MTFPELFAVIASPRSVARLHGFRNRTQKLEIFGMMISKYPMKPLELNKGQDRDALFVQEPAVPGTRPQSALISAHTGSRRTPTSQDCKHRGNEVILEAQLLTEMNPMVWMEEEGQEAEIALSRLLVAHPAAPRSHWHNGFYSKPFKERTRLARDGVAEHCEWFRWQKPAPLSAESHAAADATRLSKAVVAEPAEDDDEDMAFSWEQGSPLFP